jgi:hypothetical protein
VIQYERKDREDRKETFFSADFAASAFLVALALVFLALHLPYLPRSLEDLDSINFALGVRRFDVAQHQPHPPGYPVYVAIGKAAHALVADEVRALGLVGALAGALGVVAIGALFRRLGEGPSENAWAVAATAIAITSPLYWFTAARPLSDMSGLAAAVAVQALALGAKSPRAFAGAAFAAGLASGIRSQVAWLTLPLLIVRGLWGSRTWGLTKWGLGGFSAGVLLWFVPLVAITGGPAAYWRALSNQGSEDFGNISMLWTTHTARAAADALYFRFVAPWASSPIAALMLALAAIGLVALARRNRRALLVLAAAFGPYLVFDLLFQETFTGRYALPLLVPLAYLAATALRALPWQSGLALAAAVAMFDAHVSGTSIAAFQREPAPAFRLLDDMAAAARAAAQPPVLAMDRRNAFDFRRPIVWTNGAMPRIARQLPAPPQHEWLEAVNYWNSGGRAPVWFVVDPKRAAMELVQHGEPVRYRWPLPYPDLVSGARPSEMDWYRVDQPDWYAGEGWSLTPEAAGVADADRRGLAYGPISAWVRTALSGGSLMIGGRNFEPERRARLSVALDGRSIEEQTLPPGPFLYFASLPGGAADGRYAALTVASDPGARVAIEQFDASETRPLIGFGAGWHEPELNPRTGLRWRWLSERGELRVRSQRPRGSLHVEGESPRRYFSRGSRLAVTSNGVSVFERVLDDDFSIDVPIENLGDTIVLETDQTYVPAERSRRTQDRRHLGLRIFNVRIR